MSAWTKIASPSFDEACRAAAVWIVIVERLGARVIFAVVGSEDCSGFTFFVAIEPDTRHCEVLRCFREVHQYGECARCDDADDLEPDTFHCEKMRTRYGAAKKTAEWLPQSEAQILEIARRLRFCRHLDRSALLQGIKMPTRYDLDRFLADAFAASEDRDR